MFPTSQASAQRAKSIDVGRVHFAIFGLSLWSLVLGARTAVDASWAATERLNRRESAVLLIAVAGMFGLLWLSQIGQRP